MVPVLRTDRPRRNLPFHHMNLSPILMELHFIHQLIDEENPAAVIGVEILSPGTTGNGLGIEPRPRIAHDDKNSPLLVTGYQALHDLSGILSGAMHHGIG